MTKQAKDPPPAFPVVILLAASFLYIVFAVFYMYRDVKGWSFLLLCWREVLLIAFYGVVFVSMVVARLIAFMRDRPEEEAVQVVPPRECTNKRSKP